MNFAQKLDLLMNITNTSNIMLARNISLDASVISRLRRGTRLPARNATYFNAMAKYFAGSCGSEYKKAALLEAIKTGTPDFTMPNNTTLDLIIYQWLGEFPKTTFIAIDDFMDNIINFSFNKMASLPPVDIELAALTNPTNKEIEVFYGNKGKQDAVLAFLATVLKNPKPQTLFLFSDEDIEWLTEPAFLLKWATLMREVLAKGNHVTIIHNIARNFDEMLSGIKGWMPLYMTGAIKPYYYPKSRDGLFHHTFFIAPDTIAVTSTSINHKTATAPNLLIQDKAMVNALNEEFQDFLTLCRPLMYIFTAHTPSDKDYLVLLNEFEQEASPAIIKCDYFSGVTVPTKVLRSILDRTTYPEKEKLISFHQQSLTTFEQHLRHHNFTEIISIPPLEQIKNGQIPVSFTDMLNYAPIFYSPAEYLAHLNNIIYLLKTYPNYQVIISRDQQLEGSMIYIKEDIGVLVGKTQAPSAIFAINEANMTAAFWEYMNLIIHKNSPTQPNRNLTIQELEEFAQQLA